MNIDESAILNHQVKMASNEDLLKLFAECISMYDHEGARLTRGQGMAWWGEKKTIVETEILKRMSS